MLNDLGIIGRRQCLFEEDMEANFNYLEEDLKNKRVLVVGAAGTIGQAVTVELFKIGVAALHVVDLSENNLVELTRRLRSSEGYSIDDYKTFCIDVGSEVFDTFFNSQIRYDYIFNLSALKHVRSEKDPFTLMRMIQVNIINSVKLQNLCMNKNIKYFCVSSDKAANPANLMGATKRIMELMSFNDHKKLNVSMARFANVAFSDGSLLHGFRQRLSSQQPISAPNDVERYFILPQEAGKLCLLSGIMGCSGEIYFPNSVEELKPITFSSIAERFVRAAGYEPYICQTEDEARRFFSNPISNKKIWPCYFFQSDTTGEKPIEEFYTEGEELDVKKFKSIGIVKPSFKSNTHLLESFLANINGLVRSQNWTKEDLVGEIRKVIPELDYSDLGKFLDGRM